MGRVLGCPRESSSGRKGSNHSRSKNANTQGGIQQEDAGVLQGDDGNTQKEEGTQQEGEGIDKDGRPSLGGILGESGGSPAGI